MCQTLSLRLTSGRSLINQNLGTTSVRVNLTCALRPQINQIKPGPWTWTWCTCSFYNLKIIFWGTPSIEPRIVSFSIRFCSALDHSAAVFAFFRFFNQMFFFYSSYCAFVSPDFFSFLFLCCFLVGHLSVFELSMGNFGTLPQHFSMLMTKRSKVCHWYPRAGSRIPTKHLKTLSPMCFAYF